MDAVTRKLVVARARNSCEYCGMHQDDDFFRFHVDHVVPKQHFGSDEISNLALACVHCNLHKGTNLSAIDPESKMAVRIFNPREDEWGDHFRRTGAHIIGLTRTGRATVRLLDMNDDDRAELRRLI